MPNQYPQPEIYSTTHTFSAGASAATTSQVTINTAQASNEEVRIYGISVDILDSGGTPVASTAWQDFDLLIQVGSNNVPSQRFRIGWINRKNDKTMEFAVPILKLFSQPLVVSVQNTTADPGSNARIVRIIFHAELVNQAVECAPDGGPRAVGA